MKCDGHKYVAYVREDVVSKFRQVLTSHVFDKRYAVWYGNEAQFVKDDRNTIRLANEVYCCWDGKTEGGTSITTYLIWFGGYDDGLQCHRSLCFSVADIWMNDKKPLTKIILREHLFCFIFEEISSKLFVFDILNHTKILELEPHVEQNADLPALDAASGGLSHNSDLGRVKNYAFYNPVRELVKWMSWRKVESVEDLYVKTYGTWETKEEDGKLYVKTGGTWTMPEDKWYYMPTRNIPGVEKYIADIYSQIDATYESRYGPGEVPDLDVDPVAHHAWSANDQYRAALAQKLGICVCRPYCIRTLTSLLCDPLHWGKQEFTHLVLSLAKIIKQHKLSDCDLRAIKLIFNAPDTESGFGASWIKISNGYISGRVKDSGKPKFQCTLEIFHCVVPKLPKVYEILLPYCKNKQDRARMVHWFESLHNIIELYGLLCLRRFPQGLKDKNLLRIEHLAQQYVGRKFQIEQKGAVKPYDVILLRAMVHSLKEHIVRSPKNFGLLQACLQKMEANNIFTVANLRRRNQDGDQGYRLAMLGDWLRFFQYEFQADDSLKSLAKRIMKHSRKMMSEEYKKEYKRIVDSVYGPEWKELHSIMHIAERAEDECGHDWKVTVPEHIKKIIAKKKQKLSRQRQTRN